MSRHYTWNELHPNEPKKCKYCGKSFVFNGRGTGHINQCSDACYEAYKKERHNEREKARQKARRKATKKPKKSRTCLVCGAVFCTYQSQAKYCSSTCKCRAKRGVTKRTCIKCGVIYFSSISNQCPECSKNKNETRKLEMRTCTKCNALFQPINKNQIRCSAKCKKEFVYTCEICGKVFKTFQPMQKTCSGNCKEIRDKQQRKNAARIRKRRYANIEKENGINLESVAKKEKNICYLCGALVDWNDCDKKQNKYYGKYPSIEHIVPISKGGADTWDNVKLAHISCNSRKGNKKICTEKIISATS